MKSAGDTFRKIFVSYKAYHFFGDPIKIVLSIGRVSA